MKEIPAASEYTKEAAMRIVNLTIFAHRSLCEKLGIFNLYEEVLKAGAHIGGKGSQESQDHFLTRFLNSAARTQLPLVAQDEPLAPINDQLLAQLLSGVIYIVDIAAGNGAGVISMLNTIAHQRLDGRLPKDLLDVHIHAIDFSTTSLSFYRQELDLLEKQYAEVAIKVFFHSYEVDITDDVELEKHISNIKDFIGEDPRYLLVCSAISGVSKVVFKKSFSSSYKRIAKSFRAVNSLFLWVEPLHKGRWVKGEAEALHFALDDGEHSEPKEFCEASMSFCWIDPYRTPEEPITTGAEYFLLELA
jgi:hypothetical protein